MCGIVGVINPGGKYVQGTRKIFQEIVFADVLRGPHSTGLAKINKDDVDWRKAATPPWEFFRIKNVDEFMNVGINGADFLIGHNRFATRGEVSNENAHPFQHKHITLVHNGTLFGGWQKDLQVKKGIEVDSEGIAYAISKQGIEAVSPLLVGAYALVWHDAEKKSLNLLRNKERPLFLMYSKELILYGSEVGLLRWVLTRNGMIPEKWEEVQTHHVYSFPLGKWEPTKTEVKPYIWKYAKHFQPAHRGFQDLPGVGDDGDVWGDACPAPVILAPEPRHIHTPKSQVVPFRRKEQPLAGVLRTTGTRSEGSPSRERLRNMVQNWPVGASIYFCLTDYGDSKCQGEFYPVVGFHPVHQNEVVVKGNFSGKLEALKETSNQLCGIVTQASLMKREDKILIQVKEVTISAIPDKELVEKTKPAEDNQGHTCKECNHKFSFKNHDDPLLVRKNGLETIMCMDCAAKHADQVIEASKIGVDGITYH